MCINYFKYLWGKYRIRLILIVLGNSSICDIKKNTCTPFLLKYTEWNVFRFGFAIYFVSPIIVLYGGLLHILVYNPVIYQNIYVCMKSGNYIWVPWNLSFPDYPVFSLLSNLVQTWVWFPVVGIFCLSRMMQIYFNWLIHH